MTRSIPSAFSANTINQLNRAARSGVRAAKAARWSKALESLEGRRLNALDGGETPEPVEPDDFESNNTFAEATHLPLGEGLPGNLTIHGTSSNLDKDYFRIVAPNTDGFITFTTNYDSVGDPSLLIYNSAQQQIGTANTSGSNGRKITIFAAANQTIYARVGGFKTSSYSITAKSVDANWGWSMTSRLGGAAGYDQYGQPIINNTAAYARPNETSIGGRTVSQFPVTFGATAGVGSTGAAVDWNLTGNVSEANNTQITRSYTGATVSTNLPNGSYSVTMTISIDGITMTKTAQINVRNYMLVAIGDSYSSGEGNPHANQEYDFFGFTTKGASWAAGGDDQETRFHRMAHRSSKAAVAQAALAIENADPHTSVTFIFLSATGATIQNGILGTKPSGEVGQPGTLPSQIGQLRDVVDNRHIDALTMSIGGNDIGFGDIFAGLADADPIFDPVTYLDDVEETLATAEEKLTHLAGWYQQLAGELNNFDIGQTFITEYPDLTKNGNGQFAEILGDVGPGWEVDVGELQKAVNRLMVPFVTTMRQAAAKFDWSWVGGISDQFANGGHGGYGQILRSCDDSIVMQGPLGWLPDANNPLTAKETKGMMHPIGVGLDIQKNAILDAWRKPELVVDSFSPGADAMLPNPQAGYSIRVRNKSFLTNSGASFVNVHAHWSTDVKTDKYKLIEIPVRALSPQESLTLNGTFAATNDPFRTIVNSIYLGAIIDPYGQIGEANELNNGPRSLHKIQPDKDWDGVAFMDGAYLTGPSITLGGSTNANLGIDEVIGNYDIDTYRFTVTAGQRVAFDVDSSVGIDTVIKLYGIREGNRFDGLLASNDNGAAPGENAGEQSYLTYTFAQAGTYAISIMHKASINSSQVINDNRGAGQVGPYTLVTSFLENTAPTVLASGYDVNAHRAWFRFSEDVNGSFNLGSLKLVDRTHGNALITAPASLANYDTTTNTAWFNLRSDLADADFRFTLPAGSFSDTSGNASTADASSDLFVLAGDLNRDRKVNFGDLLILAQNYGKTGRTYAQGNVNRSAEGTVNFSDLLILAQRYGHTMAAAPTGLVAEPAVLASKYSVVHGIFAG